MFVSFLTELHRLIARVLSITAPKGASQMNCSTLFDKYFAPNGAKNMNRFITFLALLVATAFSPAGHPQTQDDSSRQIVLDRFNKARPPENAAGGSTANASRRTRRPNVAAMRPRYRRTSPLATPLKTQTEEIGITVWRLRPARSSDTGARVLVLDGLKQEPWVAERIEADTTLKIGDRVRITVESPRRGYLYIVDREQYADGSLGAPMLIFPTLRTRGGDNRVEAGKLIDIPAQEDQYSYFTAQPAAERRDQVAEVLTIILVPQPLPLSIGDQPLRIEPQTLATWEKTWSGVTERLELVDGAGRIWTDAEKLAGAAGGRQLTQTGPPPQTVYRLARKAGGSMLVTVPLRYSK